MPEIDFRSLDWDDSELIKAYKTVLKDRKAKANKPKPEWKVGDHCRAIYPVDDFYYEAKIIDIDDTCVTVEFLGYNETEYAGIEELEESKGINAQREQIEAALMESRDQNDSRNAFHSYEWDDNELITAYKMGIEAKKDKEIAGYNTDSPLPKVRSSKWRRLDHCRAIYPADKLYREAKIINCNGDFCTVEFLGYGDTKDVDFHELKKSKGKRARKKQVKAVMTASCDKNSSVNESETSGNTTDVAVASCNGPSRKKKHRVERTVHDKTFYTTMDKATYCQKCHAAAPAYPMPTNLTFRPPPTNMPQKSMPCVPPIHLNSVPRAKPMHQNSVPYMCQNPVPCMHQNPMPCAPSMHQNSLRAQSMYPNSVPHASPMHRNSVLPIPTMPPCSCFANNTAFYSMLTAWYMAGYYTGIYSLKSA